jgi:hypothetical protein
MRKKNGDMAHNLKKNKNNEDIYVMEIITIKNNNNKNNKNMINK